MLQQQRNQGTLAETIYGRLEKLSVSAICDAMVECGYSLGNAFPAAVKPVCFTQKIIGLATPIKAIDGNSLPLHLAIYLYSRERILVVATDSYDKGPYLGDIMALTAQLNGCNGIVIDGYIRDIDSIRQLDIPVFCRGAMPNKLQKTDEGSINFPITIGSTEIHSGDIIVGDENGIVIIPEKQLERVVVGAEKKEVADNKRRIVSAQFDYATVKTKEDYIPIMTNEMAQYIVTKNQKK